MDPQSLQFRRRIRVLVVDDDPSFRCLAATILRHGGYVVATAKDGFQALEWIVSEEPDIILLDLLMPILEGSDVLQEVRAHHPRTPVIIVSGAPDAKVRAARAGASALLTKPFDVAELLGAVAEVASTRLA